MYFQALIAAAMGLATIPAYSANIYADFVTIDPISEVATGVLGGVTFTLQATRVAPRPLSGDNGGIVGGVTNETSPLFSSNFFTPPQPLGDAIFLGAASDYKISFARPVSSFSFHISQLEANRLTFFSGAMLIPFSLISSDGDLTTSAGSTAVQGIVGSFDDASGTLFFNQTVSDISWTSSRGVGAGGNTAEDGIGFQLSVLSQPSVVPEPPAYLLMASAFAIMLGYRRRASVFGGGVFKTVV